MPKRTAEVFDQEYENFKKARYAIEHEGSLEELRELFSGICDDYEHLLKLNSRLIRHSDKQLDHLYETSTKLEEIAFQDQLTGIANRRGFFQSANKELDRASRFKHPFSLFIFDVDHFKKVNDTYGHDVGDIVLQNVAQIGTEALREVDLFGRIGGEEFAVVIPEADATGAKQSAERLREAFECLEVQTGDHSIKFTASFGVCSVDAAPQITVEEVLKRADIALYQAKSGGRNRVVTAE